MTSNRWKPAGRLTVLAAFLALTGGSFVWWHGRSAHVWAESAPTAVQTDPAVRQHANAMSQAFRTAANAVLPTVVTIETRSKPKAALRGNNKAIPRGQNPFKGTPFEDFFNDDQMPNPRFGDGGGVPHGGGTGSGVIIDPNGTVLTNNHVVEGADEVVVRLSDGREFKADDIKTDPQTDLAVLRIKGAGSLPAARLGDSDRMEIGDWVIAVGNPFGLDSTVSSGIISGKGRELSGGQRARYLQTDAAINPGNSGGPLVNLDGEVIGINTAIASRSGGFQGIGFAIPSNTASWVVKQLINSGSVRRAYLGVGIEQVNGSLADKFGVKQNQGVLVAEVFPDSPAAKAGFKEGDVIVRFAGLTVRNPRDLQEVVEKAEFDSKQKVDVIRDGKEQTLEVVVKPLPETFGRQAGTKSTPKGDEDTASGFHSKELGIEVSSLGPREAEQLGFQGQKGVVITDVDADGPAATSGLRPGMLVTKVGKQTVETLDQFKDAVSKQSVKDGVLLLVRSDTGQRFVVIQQK